MIRNCLIRNLAPEIQFLKPFRLRNSSPWLLKPITENKSALRRPDRPKHASRPRGVWIHLELPQTSSVTCDSLYDLNLVRDLSRRLALTPLRGPYRNQVKEYDFGKFHCRAHPFLQNCFEQQVNVKM